MSRGGDHGYSSARLVDGMHTADWNYLIIGGAYKAGTTALFYYLSRHSQLLPATVKETRFFLAPESRMRRLHCYTDDPGAYASFFPPGPPGRVRLEATPFYLHDPGCAARLARILPKARMVFILRDPVIRFISAFLYARQIGALPRTLSFQAYTEAQFEQAAVSKSRDLHMGLYAEQLRPFVEQLGRERLHLLLAERLRRDPQPELDRILAFAGLSPEPIGATPPEAENKTRQYSVPFPRQWNALRFAVVRRTYRHPSLHARLRYWKHRAERLFPGRMAAESFAADSASVARLRAYYAGEAERLRAFGVEPEWPSS